MIRKKLIPSLCVVLLIGLGACVSPPPQATPAPEPTLAPLPTLAKPSPTVVPKTVLPPTPQIVGTATPKPAAQATLAPTVAATKAAVPTGTPSAQKQNANGILVKPALATFGVITGSQTAMYLTLDGKTSDGKPLKGNMAVVVKDDTAAKQQHVEIQGNLIGPLLQTQLRGFSPRGIGIFTVPSGTFVRLDTLLTVCAKPKTGIPGLSTITSGLSADAFLNLIGGSAALQGKLVGEENLAGMPVLHYTLDLAAMQAQAKQLKVELPNLSRGEVWLAKAGGYVVRLSVAGNGKLQNLAGNNFEGNFDVILDTVSLNQPLQIMLPPSCNRPIEV